MFKITTKQQQQQQRPTVNKPYMKLIAIEFDKASYASKREIQNYYKKNSRSIGVVADVMDSDQFNETEKAFTLQICSLYKEPEQVFKVSIQNDISLVYSFDVFKNTKEDEVKAFDDKVKLIFE